jgi:NtrC-family two-component system response regulator AlgB
VRVIAATNRDLAAEVRAGNFREDLFYRLNVITVTLPPLRDRPGDLTYFAKEYLEFFSKQLGRKIDGFSDGGRAALMRHAWPGNLRELRNAIERAAILARGDKLEAVDLPDPSARPVGGETSSDGLPDIGGEHSLEDIEQAHMIKVLGWAPSLHDAAAVLGIDKATLYRKRKRYSID